MRSTALLGVVAAVTAVAACASSGVNVRTTAEPGANLSGLHTFSVLAPPARRSDAAPLSTNDPMLDNSITNRQLRTDLQQAFQSRGYVSAPRANADFVVAYYAGTKEKFDTTYWGPAYDPAWRYSYWGRRNAWAWPYGGSGYAWNANRASVSSYTQGEVIVDVTDPRSQQLLWRGQGVEPVSSDPVTYAKDMQTVVNAIVAKFPQGSATSAMAGPR